MHFDIFNGDADGIFALHQMRLEDPKPAAALITGVKRDIKLLSRVAEQKNCSLCVFDVSLDSNRRALGTLLKNNNSIEYFDHHFAGTIPDSSLLQHTIDVSAQTCTALIVNKKLAGKHSLWAICGAFGDNLHQHALQLAKDINLSATQVQQLQELGELFNYNGYGATLNDLHFHPEELYLAVSKFKNPFEFLQSSTSLTTLRHGYKDDLETALKQKKHPIKGNFRAFIFPNAPWARRIQGVFSNMMAREKTDIAHAIISENDDQTLMVSLRAPLNDRRDADTLCKQFPTGGGRAAAAGINSLPPAMIDDFFHKLNVLYP